MIVNHLHRLHLPKPTPEQMEGKFLEYQNEIEGLKKRVQDLKGRLLKTKPQCLDVALLKSDELVLYTGLNRALFDILLEWLHPALHIDAQGFGFHCQFTFSTHWPLSQ